MEDQLIDFVLHRKIRHATADASQARRDARDARTSLQDLEERVGRLTLACTAMWDLLRSRFGLTDQDLLDFIQEVDLRDGQPDGKHNPRGRQCPGCNRVNNLRRRSCMYCESPLPAAPLT